MAPNPPDKRVQVKIEVGHQATCREIVSSKEKFTHEWTIYVRGADGADISHFVEKVVFFLHESFPKPKRMKKEPPYEITERGYGSFTLPIEICFRHKEDPRKYRLDYDLSLQIVGMPPLNITKLESLTFMNPSEDFEKRLIKGGAVVLGPLSSPTPMQPLGKGEALSKVSPASSHGSSPGSVKKFNSNSKPLKKETNNILTPQHNSHVKRSAADDAMLQKPKKKKIDKTEYHTPSQKSLKEISILSSSSSSEIDSASKSKTLSYTKKIKDRRKSSEGITNNITTDSPMHSHNKIKGKEMKIKKDKKKSPDGSSDDQLPKLQSITIKRVTDDAWSSINTPIITNYNNNNVINKEHKETNTGGTSDPSKIPKESQSNQSTTTSTKQNERVNALFAEFADEESSEEDFTINSFDLDDQKSSNHLLPTNHHELNSHNFKNHNNNNIDTVKPKKSKQKNGLIQNGKLYGSQVVDEHVNKKNIEPMESLKSNGITNGSVEPLIKTEETSSDLYDIYMKLNNSEDSELLQKVVDIVEETGLYEITSSTFDFDLRGLDDEIINKIKECLEII